MSRDTKLKRMLDIVWPIQPSEFKTFLPTFLLFFLISGIYNYLRPLKIAMVISAPNSGAEIIPYIKVWGVVPAALFVTYLFTLLNNRFDRDKVFVIMTSGFLGFFILFLSVIFPLRELFQLHAFGEWMRSWVPAGSHGLVAMFEYWHYTLFYLAAELWSSVILSMLFWGYVNEVTPLDQAKRFYGIFALGANLASIAAGHFGMVFSSLPFNPNIPYGKNAWDQSVFYIIGSTIICCLGILAIFYYLKKQRETPIESGSGLKSDQVVQGKKPKKKESFGLKECFVEMVRSPYLAYMALIVLGYNLVFNLTDVMWTDQLRQQFASDSLGMNSYMSKVTMVKGFLAAFIAIFVSGISLKRFGWRTTALLTPISFLVTSAIFFPLVLGEETSLEVYLEAFFGMPFLYMSVLIGAFQNSLTRALKYTVYDATKEIAYIPLSDDEKRKGKAVIDGVGSRIGKSAGSITFQILLLFCSSLSATVPYIAVLVLIVCAIWIFSVHRLHSLMNSRMVVDERKSA